ncbi:MAG: hypothetical protein V2I79_09790 [Xanthomonadales bacterium]|jgi:hypothetical protein|nr:hypothetical protein [Xanthomonadales bacterium]
MSHLPAIPRLNRWLIVPLLAIASHTQTAAAENGAPPGLFGEETNLELTVSAPWEQLLDDRHNEDPYPARVSYSGPGGDSFSFDATVARRGVSRQRVCEFPPIELQVDPEDAKGSVFQGQETLRMVTHCRRPDRYDQYYLLEMMAYRMFNRITDYSFRVRPLTVHYVDSDSGSSYDTRFAFVAEDDNTLSGRTSLELLSIARVPLSRLNPDAAADLALFQYMIGNVDWSPLLGSGGENCCHNVALLGPSPLGDEARVWPLPYDFDSSGLVDAPYATPPESLGARTVTERIYRGYCAHNDYLDVARQKSLSNRDRILGVLDSDPRLDEHSREKARNYLEKYFDILGDDEEFERRITSRCRK